MKKVLSTLLICLLIAGMLAGCQKAPDNTDPNPTGPSDTKPGENKPEELVKIKVSHFPAISWAPIFVAKSQGFYAEQGMDIEFTFPGGPKGFQAMQAGDVEFCILSQEPALIAQEQGMETIFLANMLETRVYAFATTEDITEVSQLKGKTIFGSTPSSGPYTFVCSVLQDAGIDPTKDVTFMNMDTAAALAALVKGEVSGAFLSTYDLPQIPDNVKINVLVDTTNPEDSEKFLGTKDFPAEIICTTKKYAEENPEMVQKFVNAIENARQWILESTDEEVVDAVLPVFTGMDREVLLAQMGVMRPIIAKDGMISQEGQKSVVDACLGVGVITKDIPYEAVVDMQYQEAYYGDK